MSTHTPQIRLQAARRAYDLAMEGCPHWDWEGSGDGAHACCRELRTAQMELRLSKKAAGIRPRSNLPAPVTRR